MESDDKKNKLTATPRKKFGKAVRKMRKEGKIPANVFGRDMKSQSVTVMSSDFSKTQKKAGATGIIYLDVEDKSIPTLISNIQYHPSIGSILHVDFRAVNLKEKIEAEVPVKFVGVSEAVEQKNGVLITQLDHIEVEALPADMPAAIEVDISALKEIGTSINIADLKKDPKYAIKDEATRVIVSVTEHKEESTETETTAEAPEILTEKPVEGEVAVEGATAEGAAPAATPADKKGKGAESAKPAEKPGKGGK
ncbi:hypothetical protein A2861_01275 [Candidatus Roizmanbacteria bacterium RIFCSPHIGHO2_01_FULL_38_15]|nr:MAG: hypothetical protein A2861_01275 [Candidatus Roizmanbacteria bacterium RIFCSPHIGHO2_01_FULL_38_15]OGK35815.1 MAG: hypothetical protein A3F59_03680 [Candidatus Roizmanbacteria bacterium RIFCSPHIGHO2_12_FULL_38_13]